MLLSFKEGMLKLLAAPPAGPLNSIGFSSHKLVLGLLIAGAGCCAGFSSHRDCLVALSFESQIPPPPLTALFTNGAAAGLPLLLSFKLGIALLVAGSALIGRSNFVSSSQGNFFFSGIICYYYETTGCCRTTGC